MYEIKNIIIIVCVVACAIAITTSDQTINLSALTGNLCRVSSNADVFPHAKYRHLFHRCSEPVVFVISPSRFVLLLLIIRGGDVSRNPGPIKRQCSAGCGKVVIASSKAIASIQPMSLACICKHVTSLYFDGFCYSVMYIYIRDVHAIYIYILFN